MTLELDKSDSLINQVAKATESENIMSITNTTAKVHSEVFIKRARWIYDLHKNNLLHYDRERLQRLLTKWYEGKRNERSWTFDF